MENDVITCIEVKETEIGQRGLKFMVLKKIN